MGAAKVDEIFGGLTDATDLVTGTMGIRNPNQKIQARQQMCQESGRLTMLLNGLESLAVQNGCNGLMAGDQVTVADLAVWRAVDWLSCGTLDGIPRTYIANTFPNLANVNRKIDAMPGIQGWKMKQSHQYRQ